LKKNDIFEATITDLTTEGSGVCRIEELAVFVPHTAVGDHIRVKIVKVLKKYAFGIVEQLLQPSPDRIEPACSLSQCGGCLFQHITYAAELRVKEKTVQDAFVRLGKLHPHFLSIAGADQRSRYRNKAQYPFGIDENGMPICGFYARRSHRVIPIQDCLLQPEVFRDIVQLVLEEVRTRHLPVYREDTHTGILRHLYLRKGYHSGEIMVCFVVRKDIRRDLMGIANRLAACIPGIQSIVMNCNPDRTNVILGKKTSVLWGSDTISDTMCGNTITLSPESFYQINTPQAERLYQIAAQFAQLTGQERLLDLYCGTGTIGLSMARQAKELIGVEVIPQAVENASANAQRNGISNSQFFCGDAGMIADQLLQGGTLPDVIIADPPRKGCTEQTLHAMVQMHPDRIVMISCNPATAARDCATLAASGYQVKTVQPVDLFPGTGHVETVVLLGRKMVDDRNIEYEYIDYEPKDNEYMRNTKGSATYAEIKAWIKKQYNVSVSNLYIAQCKDECGFEKRENFNTGAEGHRVPQCPEEKREMIMEAFKHFRMI